MLEKKEIITNCWMKQLQKYDGKAKVTSTGIIKA